MGGRVNDFIVILQQRIVCREQRALPPVTLITSAEGRRLRAHARTRPHHSCALSTRRPLRGLIYLSLHYITRSGFRDADVHTPTAVLAHQNHQNQVSPDSDYIKGGGGAGQPVFVF